MTDNTTGKPKQQRRPVASWTAEQIDTLGTVTPADLTDTLTTRTPQVRALLNSTDDPEETVRSDS